MADPTQCAWCSGGGTRPEDHDPDCAFRKQMIADYVWQDLGREGAQE